MSDFRITTKAGDTVYVLGARGKAQAKAVAIDQYYDVARIDRVTPCEYDNGFIGGTVLQAYDLEY